MSLLIPAAILAAALLLILLLSYICFRMAFYAPPRKPTTSDAIEIPQGECYEAFRPEIEQWIREVRRLPYEDMTVTSFDGLTLYGKFYEYAPGAPIELMLHGYRGSAERDLAGGVQRCFRCGRSVLLVDQRCCGRSEGSVITFGIRERRDCLSWLELLAKRFPDRKIILTGVSMGAATVCMLSGQELPEAVIGILADCGYTSPKAIIQEVIRQMKLPPSLSYPFVKLGARLWGGFDLEEIDPITALKTARVPIIFFHGEADDFVPCHMSQENHGVCAASRKRLVTIPGAGHGLCYPVDQQRYLRELSAFFGPEASHPDLVTDF